MNSKKNLEKAVLSPEAAHLRSLKQSLREANLGDLVRSLKRTRDSVAQAWDQNELTYFTDHSHRHSLRVASLAHKIATEGPLTPELELNPLERYLLEMAAWLHDIGMQAISYRDDGEEGALPTDRDEVRRKHPQASREMIVEEAIELGLPEGYASVREFIALLAQSHGTSYYSESVADLAQIPELNDVPIRGPLLASILLMADERDCQKNGGSGTGLTER